MSTKKRFPADTKKDTSTPTFLFNKKIDGELYALYQSCSTINEQKQTIVKKKDLPTAVEIGKKLGIKSRQTILAHRKALIDAGYIIDDVKNKQYILPNKEEIYFMIPLDTLKFINDNLREHVIKTYIYLGQRWKYKGDQYLFSIKEIGEHLGINMKNNHSRDYEKINNALLCLNVLGLIDWEDTTILGENGILIPYKRLTNFSFDCPQSKHNHR